MGKKRITKRELKEDGFILFVRRVGKFADQNKGRVISWTFIAILVLVLTFIIMTILQRWEIASFEEFESAQTLYNQKSFKQAKERFEKILKDYPISSSKKLALFYKGNCHYRLREYDEAFKDFERFIKRNPNHFLAPFAQEAIANIYEQRQDYLKAISAYQVLTKEAEGPNTIYAWLSIGRCHKKLGNYKEAREAYEKVIEAFPQSSWVEEARLALEKIKTNEK